MVNVQAALQGTSSKTTPAYTQHSQMQTAYTTQAHIAADVELATTCQITVAKKFMDSVRISTMRDHYVWSV